jgi:hypothetical protein
MLSKKIHNFWIGGVIKDDANIIKTRENFERLLVQQMRDKGYVPVLDMMPQFSVKYNQEKNEYGFNITMYGIFVGKKKAFKLEGFSGQGYLPR